MDKIEEVRKVIEMEEELSKLHSAVTTIESGMNEKVKNLKSIGDKLKHRDHILKQAIEEAEKLPSVLPKVESRAAPKRNIKITGMISISEHLVDFFTDAIQQAYPMLEDIRAIITPVAPNKTAQFGDYQCNSAMQLSKILKKHAVQAAPFEVAQKILTALGKSPVVSKVELAKPGFLNIVISKDYASVALTSVLQNGVNPPELPLERVLVDFSSPNIAKEMHVGHLRSTIIGESTCRLLEFLGHDVIRVNHLGDWGTQFGMLIAHLEERFPNYLRESPPISDLQAFYKESKARFDSDEEFKKRAYNRVVRLQQGDAESKHAWNLICDVSRKEFKNIYDRLDVTITEKGESFYQSRMVNVVEVLAAKGLLEEDEGRKIMWVDEQKSGIPLTIVKSDGGYTYDTSDMAAIRYRLEEEKATWLIYVVDAGQNTHLKNIYLAAERAGFLDPKKQRADHVQFGVVLGEDGKKFKTRSGDTVKLTNLLDEGMKRALDKLVEKGRDKAMSPEELRAAQESVAYGCIKYADLSHNRIADYVFSFDKMLDDRGNTAVYLLYAYTRICSIARNCGQDFSNISSVLQSGTKISLDHEKEWKLAKQILKLPDVLVKISRDLLLHTLCEFCFDLCTVFSEFYDCCYCIEKNERGEIVKVNSGRILLCEATAAVLRTCFGILGLKPVEKL